MKSTNRLKGLVGGAVMGVLLFSTTFSSQAEEIRFLKIKQMKAQQEMGSAIMESGRLGWSYGRVQEQIGKTIRDAGPGGNIDQGLLGKGIADAARLKWQAGLSEEALGSAIVKASMIVANEAAITGNPAIQERLGAVIQAQAQRERIAAEEAKSFAATRAGAIQEAEGRRIQKEARFHWAEGEVAKAVRTADLSGEVSEPIPSEVLFSLRSTAGFVPEENLRIAFTSMEQEKGIPFTKLLPAPEVVTAAGPVTYAQKGSGGFAEFGLVSLLAFGWAMVMFSWVITDLDHGRMEEVEEVREAAFRKAA